MRFLLPSLDSAFSRLSVSFLFPTLSFACCMEPSWYLEHKYLTPTASTRISSQVSIPGVQRKSFSCQVFAFLENSPANLLLVPTHGFVCLWDFTVGVFIAQNDHITHQGLSDKEMTHCAWTSQHEEDRMEPKVLSLSGPPK